MYPANNKRIAHKSVIIYFHNNVIQSKLPILLNRKTILLEVIFMHLPKTHKWQKLATCKIHYLHINCEQLSKYQHTN
jgi:hypothetical protein